MSVRRTALAAAMTVAAIGVAIPAVASATEWQMEGKPVKGHVEIGLTGVEVLKSMGAEQECEFHATITIEGGAAVMSEYEVTGETCVGSGLLAACPVILTKITNTPWKIDIQENDITTTGVEIYKTYSPTCLVESTETTTGKTTITLNETSGISSGNIHALPQTDINGSGVNSEMSGSFEVDKPNAGTYGIG